MNGAMYAVMKKDFRGIISNRRLFSELLIVPLILTIVLPSIFAFFRPFLLLRSILRRMIRIS